jgi:hypothetical protein
MDHRATADLGLKGKLLNTATIQSLDYRSSEKRPAPCVHRRPRLLDDRHWYVPAPLASERSAAPDRDIETPPNRFWSWWRADR